jgi:hypothetical protein
MNKTQWYPADISPVRNGVYETKHYLYGTAMRKWSGGLWTDINGRFVLNRSVQRCSKWRGLIRKAQEK